MKITPKKIFHPKTYITVVPNGNRTKLDSTGGIPSTVDRIKLLEDNLKPEQKLWYVAFPGLHQYIIVVAENPDEARELFKKCSSGKWLNALCTVFTSEEWKKFKSAYPLEPNAVLQ